MIKEGMPEIEIVKVDMVGREESEEYEMEIWVPVQWNLGKIQFSYNTNGALIQGGLMLFYVELLIVLIKGAV